MPEYHDHKCTECGKARIPKTGKRGRPKTKCPACLGEPVVKEESQASIDIDETPVVEDEPALKELEAMPKQRANSVELLPSLPKDMLRILCKDAVKGDVLYSNRGRKKLGRITSIKQSATKTGHHDVKFSGSMSPLSIHSDGTIFIVRK